MYVENQLEAWKKTLWNDIDTNEMEEAIKRIPKELRTLHKNVRYVAYFCLSIVMCYSTSNAFVELSSSVRTFQNSLPLIANLAHPAMRPRHWQLLMEATHTRFGTFLLLLMCCLLFTLCL